MSNYSRYDFMKASSEADPITGVSYPDPLTMDISNAVDIPIKPNQVRALSRSDIVMLPRTFAYQYQDADIKYDDLILTLNGYAHRNFINEGDEISFPSIDSLRRSVKIVSK